MQQHTIAALTDRIARGRRDGDVDPDVDPRGYAEFLMNTIVGLRVMAKTNDAPMLHRIIDSALAGL
jgi:TetR/AcrR family transcriptional repressor of nem operon